MSSLKRPKRSSGAVAGTDRNCSIRRSNARTRATSRGELLQRVWGAGFDGYEHTVNSHINRLRTKIESDPGDPRRIVTVWGVGYRFDDASA